MHAVDMKKKFLRIKAEKHFASRGRFNFAHRANDTLLSLY